MNALRWCFALVYAIATLTSSQVHAQRREFFHRYDLTLIFVTDDTLFDAVTRRRMIETFFEVYPGMVKTFNPLARQQVMFHLDSTYHGVAEVDVSTGYVRFNVEWLRTHPEDIDVVTHEVMHIVQDYPQHAGPGWLIEGIADYARYKFGVNNSAAGWRPSPFASDQRPRDSYRVTASFLLWIERHVKPDIVYVVDKALRDNVYTDVFWEACTGKSLETLWDMYGIDSGRQASR